MIGKSQLQLDVDNETGKVEPLGTSTVGLLMAGKKASFTYDELATLFAEVSVLKQSARDSRRLAQEVKRLRIELDDTKSRVDQLAQRCSENTHAVNAECEPVSSGQANRIGHTDEDGDRIDYGIEDGKLIRYVNGNRWVGKDDRSGVVTALRFKDGFPADVRDQHGWGSSDCPWTVVLKLKEMADAVGVPNNLPGPVGKARHMKEEILKLGSIETAISEKNVPQQNNTITQRENVHTPLTSSSSDAAVNDFSRDRGQRKTLSSQLHGVTSVLPVDTWSFCQSCWDAAAFVGHKDVLLPEETLSVLMLVLVNLLAQMSFVVIVWNSLSNSSLDDGTLNGYHLWRTSTAHSVQFMDKLTLESLSSRVCRGDSSLHMSERQSQQVQDINAYLINNAPFNGPLMCFLAIFTWTLTVSKEFQVLHSMFGAFRGIPRGKTVVAMDDNGKLILQSLSYARITYLLLLNLCRAIIAGFVLVAGAKFLVVTLSIEDILLNAVALEFVLNVDELLYHALTPLKMKRMILLLRPLRKKKAPTFHGLDLNMFLTKIAIVGFVTTTVVAWMLPEIQRMRDAKSELCGGKVDFSYSLSKANYVTWASEVVVADQHKSSTQYKVLRNIIERDFDDLTRYFKIPKLQGPGWTVTNFYDWSIVELGDNLLVGCRDFAPWNQQALAALRDKFHNQSIATCADVVSHCNRFSFSIVRFWCPVSCGCNSFHSTLMLPYPSSGCPSACSHTETFQSERATAACKDVDSKVLLSLQSWQKYVANRKLVASEFPHSAQVLFNNTAHSLLVHGCAAPAHLGMDICQEPQFKSIAYWCPAACQCETSSTNIFCPVQC